MMAKDGKRSVVRALFRRHDGRSAFAAAPCAAGTAVLGRLDALIFTADERGEAGRISLIAFVIRVVSAVIAFVSQVLLARWMGSFEYGIFVLVWTTMVIVGNLACLGFHTSVIRFIPEYREKRHAGRAARHPADQPPVRAGRLDADRRPRRGRHLVFRRLVSKATTSCPSSSA